MTMGLLLSTLRLVGINIKGNGITPDTQTDAAALRREFLDDEVKMLASITTTSPSTQ